MKISYKYIKESKILAFSYMQDNIIVEINIELESDGDVDLNELYDLIIDNIHVVTLKDDTAEDNKDESYSFQAVGLIVSAIQKEIDQIKDKKDEIMKIDKVEKENETP